MLNSVEHEILNAHKYKNIKKFGFFTSSDKLRMLFPPLINVKMPTIIGILTFMSGKNICSVQLSMKIFYNLGARTVSFESFSIHLNTVHYLYFGNGQFTTLQVLNNSTPLIFFVKCNVPKAFNMINMVICRTGLWDLPWR